MSVGANKAKGAHFEAQFVARCGAYGLKALRNELSFRYSKGGKINPVRADLDYRVLRRDGRIAYVDMKVVATEHFTYAQFAKHQMQRALQYAMYNVPSGFVVLFEPTKSVAFFTGDVIYRRGPRTRFTAADGALLGAPYTFDPRLIFEAHTI